MKYLIPMILIIVLSSCNNDKLKPDIINDEQNGRVAFQESWGSKVQFSDEGHLKAVLYSDHLQMYSNPKETLLKNVKIDFYDKLGKVSTVLTSKSGKVDDLTKNMYAIDSVVAKNDSGVVLKTEKLMWRNIDKKIMTDKFVTITSPEETIEGIGFESDQSLKNYVIYKITYSARNSEKK